jgi:hypothetical protein
VSVWQEVVVGVASGIGTGVLAATLTPWAQWAVDKRRRRWDERTRIIREARALIADRQDAHRREILRHPGYLGIPPHLRRSVEARLLEQVVIAQSDPYGTAGNPYLALIRNEADRLEREWKLS